MRRLLTILVSGAVGVLIAPAVAPALGRSLRPVGRAALKAGLRAAGEGQRAAGTLRETIEDLQAEIAQERRQE
jgi:hypothetical protein